MSLKVNLNKNLKPEKYSVVDLSNMKFEDQLCHSRLYYEEKIKENDIIHFKIESKNIVPTDEIKGNVFVKCFLESYNKHSTIIIKPDDFWLVIIQQLSDQINRTPEKFRELFVSHEGKKDINIEESDLNKIISVFVETLKMNTKPEIVDAFNCNFSTTTPLISNVVGVTIMKSLESYFNYGSCCACGIPSVIFEGSINDWKLLSTKLNKLKIIFSKFELFLNYFERVDKIFLMMIKTRSLKESGEVDAPHDIVDFWSRLISYEHAYMSGEVSKIGGWINDLFSVYSVPKIYIDSFPKTLVNVDFKLCSAPCVLTAGLFCVEEKDSKFGKALGMSYFWLVKKNNKK